MALDVILLVASIAQITSAKFGYNCIDENGPEYYYEFDKPYPGINPTVVQPFPYQSLGTVIPQNGPFTDYIYVGPGLAISESAFPGTAFITNPSKTTSIFDLPNIDSCSGPFMVNDSPCRSFAITPLPPCPVTPTIYELPIMNASCEITTPETTNSSDSGTNTTNSSSSPDNSTTLLSNSTKVCDCFVLPTSGIIPTKPNPVQPSVIGTVNNSTVNNGTVNNSTGIGNSNITTSNSSTVCDCFVISPSPETAPTTPYPSYPIGTVNNNTAIIDTSNTTTTPFPSNSSIVCECFPLLSSTGVIPTTPYSEQPNSIRIINSTVVTGDSSATTSPESNAYANKDCFILPPTETFPAERYPVETFPISDSNSSFGTGITNTSTPSPLNITNVIDCFVLPSSESPTNNFTNSSLNTTHSQTSPANETNDCYFIFPLTGEIPINRYPVPTFSIGDDSNSSSNASTSPQLNSRSLAGDCFVISSSFPTHYSSDNSPVVGNSIITDCFTLPTSPGIATKCPCPVDNFSSGNANSTTNGTPSTTNISLPDADVVSGCYVLSTPGQAPSHRYPVPTFPIADAQNSILNTTSTSSPNNTTSVTTCCDMSPTITPVTPYTVQPVFIGTVSNRVSTLDSTDTTNQQSNNVCDCNLPTSSYIIPINPFSVVSFPVYLLQQTAAAPLPETINGNCDCPSFTNNCLLTPNPSSFPNNYSTYPNYLESTPPLSDNYLQQYPGSNCLIPISIDFYEPPMLIEPTTVKSNCPIDNHNYNYPNYPLSANVVSELPLSIPITLNPNKLPNSINVPNSFENSPNLSHSTGDPKFDTVTDYYNLPYLATSTHTSAETPINNISSANRNVVKHCNSPLVATLPYPVTPTIIEGPVNNGGCNVSPIVITTNPVTCNNSLVSTVPNPITTTSIIEVPIQNICNENLVPILPYPVSTSSIIQVPVLNVTCNTSLTPLSTYSIKTSSIVETPVPNVSCNELLSPVVPNLITTSAVIEVPVLNSSCNPTLTTINSDPVTTSSIVEVNIQNVSCNESAISYPVTNPDIVEVPVNDFSCNSGHILPCNPYPVLTPTVIPALVENLPVIPYPVIDSTIVQPFDQLNYCNKPVYDNSPHSTSTPGITSPSIVSPTVLPNIPIMTSTITSPIAPSCTSTYVPISYCVPDICSTTPIIQYSGNSLGTENPFTRRPPLSIDDVKCISKLATSSLEARFPKLMNVKYLDAYGPGALAASNGNGFITRSNSNVAPIGVEILSNNEIAGNVLLSGQLPFIGTVAFDGEVISAGHGSVNYRNSENVHSLEPIYEVECSRSC